MFDQPQRPPKRKRFLSMRDFAEELGISERSAWRRVEQGELSVHQFGSSTRVKREDLDAYIERCRRRQDASSEKAECDATARSK